MYEELKAFKKLLDEGAITEEDYAKQKIRILGLVGDDTMAGEVKPPLPAPMQIEGPSSRYSHVSTANESEGGRVVEELRRYKGLLDEGILSQEEFDAKKAKLLGVKVSQRVPKGDVEAIGNSVGEVRGKQASRESRKRDGHRVFKAAVYTLCAMQLINTIVFLSSFGWFRYLSRLYVDYVFSADAVATFLILVGTALIVLAVRSKPVFLRRMKRDLPKYRKVLLVSAAVFGLAAIVPAVDAFERGTILTGFDSGFVSIYISWLMLFYVLTFAVGSFHVAKSGNGVADAGENSKVEVDSE